MMSDTKRILYIPNEIIAEVAKHLYSDDPNQTLQDVENFRLVNRRFNATVVDTPRLRHANDQLNRLSRMALSIYNAVIPKDQELPDQNAEQPENAHLRVAVASKLLKFRTPSERTQLVDKVLNVSDVCSARTEASIPLMDSMHIEPEDRNKLIQNAITSLEMDRKSLASWMTPDHIALHKKPALHVLMQAMEGKYLSIEQMTQLPAVAFNARKPFIEGISNMPRSQTSIAFKGEIDDRIKPGENHGNIDANIDILEITMAGLISHLPNGRSLDAINERQEIFECLEIVAKYTSDAYEDSRHLLLANDHQISSSPNRPQLDQRGRSGRGD